MANSIALVTKFQPILDEIFKGASLTASMDAPTKPIDFGGAAEVKVFKTSVVGLGTYSRATGYPAGDVTGTWETLTLAASRGRAFSIDRMDNMDFYQIKSRLSSALIPLTVRHVGVSASYERVGSLSHLRT